ncbi:MAG TPA: acetate--CoA ligase family protein, partial [Methylomirabilota bacterium]|nr:acetate--CoA ligase family protein [Methylomirabilota bacterium]
AYGGLIIRHLGSLGLGISKFLSIGNQVDLEIADVLDYLAEDGGTTLIAAFIESVKDGPRFVEAARRATERVPVVVLKGGRTEAGRRAAGSHTGALAGAFEAYHAAFARAGIVDCRETEEFFDAIQCLATVRRRIGGGGVAIITVSGGPSVIAADTAETLGLAVPVLKPAMRGRLGALLPSFAALGNPVDLTPQVDPKAIGPAARLVLGEEDIAGAVAINVGLDLPEFADGLLEASGATGKPLVACAVDVPVVAEKFRAAAVPVYPTPERAVRAYGALMRPRWRAAPLEAAAPALPRLPAALRQLLETGRGALPYRAARRILAGYGIPFCREAEARSTREALTVAGRLGYPVVLKAARPDLVHKTEAGAVRVDLRTPRELEAACREMTKRLGPGPFLVQRQVGRGVELLVGGKRDATFGPLIACGSGGILAEALRDVAVGLAPLQSEEARGMLSEGVRGRLLRGVRGMPPCELGPIVRIVLAVSRLLADHPRIVELDLNPVIATGKRAVAVDALVICESPPC